MPLKSQWHFNWICRLIPSRVGEVTSIPIDCLYPYGDDYILKLNMFKQNGGYLEPEKRLILLKNSDMGKYLVDIIKEQQNISKSLQRRIEGKKKKLLFTYKKIMYLNGYYNEYDTDVFVLNEQSVGEFFRKISRRHNIIDTDGKPYFINTHQLRHNGITDRIYENFSLLQVKDMTHHKSTTMLSTSYVHPKKEKIIETVKNVNKQNNTPLYFKGKIINTDNEKLIDKIRRKPRAHSLGRIGFCSDITNCKNDIFACLNNCSYFMPNADELEYFEEQMQMWENKISLFKNNKYMKENAEFNYNLNKNIVDKIIKGLRFNGE